MLSGSLAAVTFNNHNHCHSRNHHGGQPPLAAVPEHFMVSFSGVQRHSKHHVPFYVVPKPPFDPRDDHTRLHYFKNQSPPLLFVVVRLVNFSAMFLHTKVAVQSGSRSNIFLCSRTW
ncbi:unnamed protein product [Vicia faba]|uniref:Uncharacterized protein n=1 Tax=Vicia faba TaxID=3906 RepID=A0AAV0YGJ1_VICFA|nr:unnamed protein product [Vicia faba]